MDGSPKRRQLRGLDLIRGIAALLVLIYHVDFMFGIRGALLPSGYLSVDLFFVLSGFVIAYTYETPVRNGGLVLRDMALRRFARLYPLYGLTFVLGLFVMTARYRSLAGHLDIGPLLVSAAANVFVLPSFDPPNDGNAMFPYNAASWSIFYELVINLVFFFYLARLSTRALALAWIAAVVCLIPTALTAGSLDVGWGTANFLLGFPRVTASFITGMLIWRRFSKASWSFPAWPVCVLVAIFVAITQVKLDEATGRAWSDLAVTLVFLPCLVIAGVGASFRQSGAAVAAFLGEISYSVYLIQDFCIITAAGAVQLFLGRKIYDYAPGVGFLFVPAVVVVSYASYRYFERPARAWFRTRQRAAPAVAGSL